METITKCLNEWNAVVEALGQGKQSILIRKYGTTLKEFLLYPTVSYANKDDYLNSFKDQHKSFVKENTLPKIDDGKVEVKYFAKVEDIIEKSTNRPRLNNADIWTSKHVTSYLGRKPAYIWLLRVYKLNKPMVLSRTRGMLYANVDKEVSLNNLTPVLSDEEFDKIRKSL